MPSFAAAAVASGSGLGAGRLRADAQRAAGVAPGDRAAARAYGVDVQGGQGERPTGDLALGALGDVAVVDQADVAGRAAHVEAEHVALAGERGEQQRAADTAGGAGEHGERGVRGGARDVGEPAGGLHDLRLGQRLLAGLIGEPAQVVGEQR